MNMNALTVVILIFAVLAAGDYLFGGKLGLGKEFEKAFKLLGTMALSMIGMIVISPLIADLLSPVFDGMYKVFRIDPSIIPASLFANDMGGAPLATAVAKSEKMGNFNGLVVASMMGATLSFTIPFAIKLVDKSYHRDLAFGLLCGVATIPVGCFFAGLICGISVSALLLDLLPLLLLAAVIAVGLIFAPEACVKGFKGLGFVIKLLVVTGLMLGILNFLAGKPVVKGLGTIEEGAIVCVNISVVLAGMLPLLYLVFKLLAKPLQKLENKVGMNSASLSGLVASLATSAPTFGTMNDMDNKGIMLNAAFATSGAFVFGDHLAFTMAFNADFVLSVVVGKLVAGVLGVALAYFLYGKLHKEKKNGFTADCQSNQAGE